MAVNSPGSYSSLKSPRSPRQLPQLPTLQQPPRPISGEHSPSQSIHNFGCKSPSTPRVFEFPPEYHPETPNANFDFDDFAKSESVSDSRSSLLPESIATGSTSNNSSSSYYRSLNFHNQSITGSKGQTVRSSPDFLAGAGLQSPVFQFCNPRHVFKKTHSYPIKCQMSAGPLGPISRSRTPTSCGSPQAFFPQKSPKLFERARRNSCFNLGPIKSPMSPTTIVTAPTEGFASRPRGSESSPKLYTGDLLELGSNFNNERVPRDADGLAGYNKAASSKQFYRPNVPPLQQQSTADTAIQAADVLARREHERNHERDTLMKPRSDRMGSISLNRSHGSLNESSARDEDNIFSSGNDRGSGGRSSAGGERSNPRNVARRSTSDLTELDADEVETEVTVLSSPRRRGSMKGGLAYLASRRGSRDSQISNVSNVSNEDVGPLNFNAHPRGRQRRTSNFLELPVPDHVRPRVHSLPEKAYNPRVGDDLYRLRAFSITHKGVVNRGDSIISRRSRSNTSVNSSRNSNVSGERSPFEGSCCSGQGVAADSSESEIDEIPKYRVVLLGDSGVGKTALVSQFMTSEYMNTYDASLDDEFGEKTVSILLDGEESEMVFIDHPYVEMSVENSLSTYEPHGCVVIYSVESRASFQVAEEMLNYLWQEHFTQDRSVIVVGNKSDLERSRTVEANEGKHLATSRECKFIETSSGIQHNVDELLVGILKQIRLRETREKKLRRQGSKGKILSKLHGSKTALSLTLAREILNKICLNDSKSKSCENLHVL